VAAAALRSSPNVAFFVFEQASRNQELARIGSLLFIYTDSPNDHIGFSSLIGTFATRLSAQPLSLGFNHEEFCDGLYVRRKTPPLSIFAGSQEVFFTAG